MKTITLPLLLFSSILHGQNYISATTEWYQDSAWINSTRILNSLNYDGSKKISTFQTWLSDPANKWQNYFRDSYTYNASGFVTSYLNELYNTSSASWKYANKTSWTYSNDTTLLSALTETSANGTSFINNTKSSYQYGNGNIVQVNTDKWTNNLWKAYEKILHDYNTDGAVMSSTFQVWNSSSNSYVNTNRSLIAYNNGNEQSITWQYWGNFGAFVDQTRRTYTYTSTGKKDVEIYEIYDEANGKWVNQMKTKYNYNGPLLSSTENDFWDVLDLSWKTSSRTTFIYAADVGVEEYFQEPAESVYFDMSGNRIEKRTNEIMVERSGSKARKVFIRQE